MTVLLELLLFKIPREILYTPNLASLKTFFKESCTVTLHLLSSVSFLLLPVNVTLLIRELKVSAFSRMKQRKKKCAKLPRRYQRLH